MTRLRWILILPFLLACGIQAQLPSNPDQQNVTVDQKQAQKTPQILENQKTVSYIPPVQIVANVNIRNYSGTVIGTLLAGDIVPAWCGWEVCYLDSGNTFWRGCSSEALAGSKCLSR